MSTSGDFALKDYIQRTASHLVAAMEAAQIGEDDDVHCGQLMVTDVIQLIIQFAKIDQDFSIDEAVLLANIIDWIDPEYRNEYLSSWTSPEQLRWIFLHLDKESMQWTGGKVIDLLSTIDDTTGSILTEEAKAMYFRIANAVVKADGKVTRNELEAIAELKESLYPARKPTDITGFEVGDSSSSQSGLLAKGTTRDLNMLMRDLESLIGLESVKHDVRKLVDLLTDQQKRRSHAQPTLPIPLSLVFFGNPGTGKLTVARTVVEIYGSLGFVSRGHLVESDQAHMVAGSVGHTAPKVRQVIESALGGALYIDEAYSLVRLKQDYEQEAVDTLLKLMDYYGEDLIVIMAGNRDKMTSFIGSDPGLRSRFNDYFYFNDYSPKELLDIFSFFCKKAGYILSKQATVRLRQVFETLSKTGVEDYGNADLAKTIFEKAINNQANRIISLSDVSEEQLSAIYSIDIQNLKDIRGY